MRWGNKDVDLRRDGLDLDTFIARLQAQKRSHSANSIRPSEPRSDTRTRASQQSLHQLRARMSSLGKETKMSNSDMTVSEPSCRTCLFSSKQTGNAARHFEHATSQCTVAYHQCGRRLHVPSYERGQPSPSRTGVFGSPPFCALPTLI